MWTGRHGAFWRGGDQIVARFRSIRCNAFLGQSEVEPSRPKI